MPDPREDHRPQPARRTPEEEPGLARPVPDESRSFDTDAPPGGHMGAAGDPAEGKRD